MICILEKKKRIKLVMPTLGYNLYHDNMLSKFIITYVQLYITYAFFMLHVTFKQVV